MNTHLIRRLAFLVALGVLPVALAQANIILDPGFESCSANFTVPPNWNDTDVNIAFCDGNKHSGTFDADFIGSPGTLSQDIATTIGDTYDFQFWLKSPAASGTFSASFGSNQVFSTTTGTGSYIFEDFTVTATSTTTTVSFTGSANGDVWSLDDISVTDLAPEPSTWLLSSLALAATFLRFRRHA
jgi:hypothetical protein